MNGEKAKTKVETLERREDCRSAASLCYPLSFGSLFAGIGGFDIGLERAGMVCKWQVEIDEFATSVLERHWPDVRRWDDVRTWPQPDTEPVDILCGGFPCQDISPASSTGTGIDGERSGLWAEFARIIRAIRPRFVMLENHAMLLVRGFDRVLRDLAASGYDAEWRVFSAYEFGAPHERERLYVVAYTEEGDGRAWLGAESDRSPAIFKGCPGERMEIWLQAASRFAGVDDGVPARSYRNRVGAIGNAVLPQIPEWIGHQINRAVFGG